MTSKMGHEFSEIQCCHRQMGGLEAVKSEDTPTSLGYRTFDEPNELCAALAGRIPTGEIMQVAVEWIVRPLTEAPGS